MVLLRKKMNLNLGFWVGFLLAIFVLLIPTTEQFTVQARNMLAIVVLMGIWWMSEALPLGVTALLPLVLFPFFKIMKTADISGNYTHHLVFLFLGGFMIASALQRWDLHRRFALLTISVLGTNPRRMILAFMLSTAVLSMWISNTATAMMMLPITLAVISQINGLHENPDDNHLFAILLLLSVAYSASIGGISTLIGTPPNIIFSGIFGKYFPDSAEISFLRWMIYLLPLSILLFMTIWLYLGFWILRKKDFPSDRESSVFRDKYKALGKMNSAQKRVLWIFIITATLWVFRTEIKLGGLYFPGWPYFIGLAGMIQDSTIAIGMAILLYIIPGTGDKKLLELGSLLDIPWDILLLFGGGFALAEGVQVSGLAIYLGDQLQFFGDLPLWLMLVTMALAISFFTEITSNTAVATTILPISAGLAINLQINPLIVMLPITIASSCAFMLPVATPPNAIIFGSRLIPIQRMVRIGVSMNIFTALLVGLYFYFLFQILGFQ